MGFLCRAAAPRGCAPGADDRQRRAGVRPAAPSAAIGRAGRPNPSAYARPCPTMAGHAGPGQTWPFVRCRRASSARPCAAPRWPAPPPAPAAASVRRKCCVRAAQVLRSCGVRAAFVLRPCGARSAFVRRKCCASAALGKHAKFPQGRCIAFDRQGHSNRCSLPDHRSTPRPLGSIAGRANHSPYANQGCGTGSDGGWLTRSALSGCWRRAGLEQPPDARGCGCGCGCGAVAGCEDRTGAGAGDRLPEG